MWFVSIKRVTAEREAAKRALRERVDDFLSGAPPEVVHDAEASRLALLLGGVDAREDAVEVLHLLALLHVCRNALVRPGEPAPDVPTALRLLVPVHASAPWTLPTLVQLGLEAALQVTPYREPARLVGRAVNLARHGRARGDVAALHEAVALYRRALELSPDDYPDRAAFLSNLCECWEAIHSATGDRTALDEAVQAGFDAVACLHRGSPHTAQALTNLGVALRLRSTATRDTGDLDTAVHALEEAVAATPADDAAWPVRNHALATALGQRFEAAGRPEDLDRAVAAARTSVDAAVAHDAELPRFAGELANLLRTRYRRTGDRADQVALVEACGVAARSTDDALRAWALTVRDRAHRELGVPASPATTARDEHARRAKVEYDEVLGRGDAHEVAGSLPRLRALCATTPLDHPDGVWWRSQLGGALLIAFQAVPDPVLLDEAVALLTDLLAVLPPGGAERPAALRTLAFALSTRFSHGGDTADLARAVDTGEEALRARPVDADLLATLSGLLVDLYKWRPDQDVVDRAVALARRAVDHTPSGSGGLPDALTALGTALLHHHRQTGDVADLDEAVDALDRAARLAPERGVRQWDTLSTLVQVRRARFLARGDREDADLAVAGARDVARWSAPDRNAQSHALLAECLAARAGVTGSRADLDDAVRSFRRAATTSGPWRMRFFAATRAATALAEHDRLPEAVEDFATAVGMLPLVAWRGLGRADREDVLGKLNNFGPRAARAAITAGQPERAVELLEQSRSVLWGQLLDTRTDLAALRRADPSLADRLDQLHDLLEHADPEERRAAAREWDDALARVRALDGFGRFLLPTPFADLAAATGGGPVVVVNASLYGCDALVVTTSGVRVVPLPHLTLRDAVDHAVRFMNAMSDAREGGGAARQAVFACLEWMWDAFARDVLDALGDGVARVWWSPTGPLNFLPLHAAGYHDPDDDRPGDTVLDRVVSSYAPSLRVLGRAPRPGRVSRLRALLRPRRPGGPLVVAVPDAPGTGPVPGAREEADLLVDRFGGTALVGAEATGEAVLAALPRYPSVHFACHGGQEMTDPGSAALLLHDGPLTLGDLVRLDLREAELAVLSACETALGGSRLLDEAVHLGAAFQVIGYREVVAALWPVPDGSGPVVAEAVHRAPSDVAGALHRATLLLRDRHREDPTAWASYLHLGR